MIKSSEMCKYNVLQGAGLTPCTSAGTPSSQVHQGFIETEAVLQRSLLRPGCSAPSTHRTPVSSGLQSLLRHGLVLCSLAKVLPVQRTSGKLSIQDECPTINGAFIFKAYVLVRI